MAPVFVLAMPHGIVLPASGDAPSPAVASAPVTRLPAPLRLEAPERATRSLDIIPDVVVVEPPAEVRADQVMAEQPDRLPLPSRPLMLTAMVSVSSGPAAVTPPASGSGGWARPFAVAGSQLATAGTQIASAFRQAGSVFKNPF
jgi:hypothetical protein